MTATTRIITLTGSDTASCADPAVTVTRKRHGVIDVLARELREHGVPDDDRLHVVRDGVAVFDRDRTLKAWAGERLTESDDTGFRRNKFKPFDAQAAGLR